MTNQQQIPKLHGALNRALIVDTVAYRKATARALVYATHDFGCIEYHNADMRARCGVRKQIVEQMCATFEDT